MSAKAGTLTAKLSKKVAAVSFLIYVLNTITLIVLYGLFAINNNEK
jgi:hypothetical protein